MPVDDGGLGGLGAARAFAGEDPGGGVDGSPTEQLGGEADLGDLVLAVGDVGEVHRAAGLRDRRRPGRPRPADSIASGTPNSIPPKA